MDHGLKLAAVAVVAAAVIAMRRAIGSGPVRSTIILAAAGSALLLPSALTQAAVIAAGAVVGRLALREGGSTAGALVRSPVTKRAGAALLAVLAVLLVTLPLLASLVPDARLAVVDGFFRAGALVFGGGHVVLPLLHGTVVANGWLGEDAFVAGYGATQAVPGPLFTFAAYLGALMDVGPRGVAGGAIALAAIFLPAFLLVWGALPFWEQLRASAAARQALLGTNAAVVGLLLAALYDPVIVTAVHTVPDAAVAAAAFLLLVTRRVAPIVAVALCAFAGEVLR